MVRDSRLYTIVVLDTLHQRCGCWLHACLRIHVVLIATAQLTKTVRTDNSDILIRVIHMLVVLLLNVISLALVLHHLAVFVPINLNVGILR